MVQFRCLGEHIVSLNFFLIEKGLKICSNQKEEEKENPSNRIFESVDRNVIHPTHGMLCKSNEH